MLQINHIGNILPSFFNEYFSPEGRERVIGKYWESQQCMFDIEDRLDSIRKEKCFVITTAKGMKHLMPPLIQVGDL